MEIKNEPHSVKFTLQLENIGQFFEAPELDPFTPQARVTAGIDDIISVLRTRRLRRPLQLTTQLVLPREQITPELENEMRAALAHYADYNLEQLRRQRMASQFEGRNKLPAGIAVLIIAGVVGFLLVTLLQNLNQTALVAFVVPFFTVIVWVGIWHPIEILLYDRWGYDRDIQIHQCLKNMEIHVQ